MIQNISRSVGVRFLGSSILGLASAVGGYKLVSVIDRKAHEYFKVVKPIYGLEGDPISLSYKSAAITFCSFFIGVGAIASIAFMLRPKKYISGRSFAIVFVVISILMTCIPPKHFETSGWTRFFTVVFLGSFVGFGGKYSAIAIGVLGCFSGCMENLYEQNRRIAPHLFEPV